MSTPSPAPPAPSFSDAVAAEIRAEIGRQALKPSAVAERIGVPAYWVTNRLNGRVSITLDDLHKIADGLGINPKQLTDRVAA